MTHAPLGRGFSLAALATIPCYVSVAQWGWGRDSLRSDHNRLDKEGDPKWRKLAAQSRSRDILGACAPERDCEQFASKHFRGKSGAKSARLIADQIAWRRAQVLNAAIRIVALKRDGRWVVHNLHVDPAPGYQAGQRTRRVLGGATPTCSAGRPLLTPRRKAYLPPRL